MGKNSEEKSKRAMVDAARLADELRAEQDHSSTQEKAKRSLETQVSELEMRLAEANDMASKGGRNAMAKLEMLTSDSKSLNVVSRSFNSKQMKITRTKNV